jgi:hypothetical protein
LPTEDTDSFDLIQDKTNNSKQKANNKERRLYEGCRVSGFELQIMRNEAIKLKLDICGEHAPRFYPYTDIFERESGEHFNSDNVAYKINGNEYKNIYGLTLLSKKQGGTRTEIWIKRTKENGPDIPEHIVELIVMAQLLRDRYERRYYGAFRITAKRMALVSDETDVNSADTVIGPLRYYVSGTVSTEVFSSTGELIP